MTILSFLRRAKENYPALSTRDIERLLAFQLEKNTAYLRAFAETQIPENVLNQMDYQLMHLAKGKPLAYLLGEQGFWDMTLRVNEHTLIPRPDTEMLIEVIKNMIKSSYDIENSDALSMLDLGTGSGALAIALARLFPNANMTATDISADALNVARENASNWSPSPIHFVQTHWFDKLTQKFDIIVSNPPYIANDDEHLDSLNHEPISALASGMDGLDDIREIIKQAPNALKDMGWLFLEHGYNQATPIRALLSHEWWHSSVTVKDYGGNDRVTYSQFRADYYAR